MKIARNPFHFSDGTVVVDLPGLVAKVLSITPDEFASYVTQEKHDFANWIKFSLHDTILGMIVEKATTPKQMAAVITKYVEQHVKHSEPKQDSEETFVEIESEKVEEPLIEQKEEGMAPDTPAAHYYTVPEKKETQEENVPPQQSAEPAHKTPSIQETITHTKKVDQDEKLSQEHIQKACEIISLIKTEMQKVCIGQDANIDKLLLAVMCRGNILIEGPTGVGKATLIGALTDAVKNANIILTRVTDEKLLDLVSKAQAPICAVQDGKIAEFKLNDKFLLKITLDYPSKDVEKQIIMHSTTLGNEEVESVASHDDIVNLQDAVMQIYLSKRILDDILTIVEKMRQTTPVSTRAAVSLALASKAYALMRGRNYVLPPDVQAVMKDVLGHRSGTMNTTDKPAEKQSEVKAESKSTDSKPVEHKELVKVEKKD